METTETVQATVGKGQVIDNVPKVIKELQFGVLSVLTWFHCGAISDPHPGQVRMLSIKHRLKYRIAGSSTSTMAELLISMDPSILAWVSLASVKSVGPAV